MKAQISFDMGVAVIATALIVYFGFYTISMLNNRTVETLKADSAFNHLIAYSEHLVKHDIAKKSMFGKTVYHHSIDTFNNHCLITGCSINDYLGFDEIRYGVCDLGAPCIYGELCIRRVVEVEGSVMMLMVCGDY